MSKPDITEANWYLNIPSNGDSMDSTLSISRKDSSWEAFVRDVNIGDSVVGGYDGMALYWGEIDSVCSSEEKDGSKIFSRKLKNIVQLEGVDKIYDEYFQEPTRKLSKITRDYNICLLPTCPNCGYRIQLMSHGICEYCEEERLMDKYKY